MLYLRPAPIYLVLLVFGVIVIHVFAVRVGGGGGGGGVMF
jgi:hypothetical protein